MNQISNERLLELGKAVTSSKICKIVHWGFRFVSNDELGAIIRRLRATEAERDHFSEQWADITRQMHESRNSATDAVRKIEAERDELKARLKHDYEEHEKSDLEMIRERDRLEEVANALAYAIGTEEEIGEHSNLNNPWENALELIAQIKSERDAWKSACDDFRDSMEVTEGAYTEAQEECNSLKAEREAYKVKLEQAIELFRLAEHKIDQTLQGEGPQPVRLGVALTACRQALLLLAEPQPETVKGEK